MEIVLKSFNIKTKPKSDIINITEHVESCLKETGLTNGIVCVHNPGSTGSISTLEFEPGLVISDVPEFMEGIIPYDKNYGHHSTWGDHNGAGHLRSHLLKTSQTFPFSSGNLLLGNWEQIVFLEFDERSRNRRIDCQFIGE